MQGSTRPSVTLPSGNTDTHESVYIVLTNMPASLHGGCKGIIWQFGFQTGGLMNMEQRGYIRLQ